MTDLKICNFFSKKSAKNPEIIAANNDFGVARREGFEPPAFWSVGCPKEKAEPFRLRFALFNAIWWVDFPLFPSGTACSYPVLGQKWVKDDLVITN